MIRGTFCCVDSIKMKIIFFMMWTMMMMLEQETLSPTEEVQHDPGLTVVKDVKRNDIVKSNQLLGVYDETVV